MAEAEALALQWALENTAQLFESAIELVDNRPAGGGGGGEANTASNVGGGTGVFLQKTGVDLEFLSLLAGSDIQITDDGNEITITNTSPGGGGGLKEQWWPSETDMDKGDYRVKSVGASGEMKINFQVPSDFSSLWVCEAYFINIDATVGVGPTVDVSTSYGQFMEAQDTHTGSLVNFPISNGVPAVDAHGRLLLNGALGSLAANDRVGVTITHNAIGGSLGYFAIRLIYIPS